MPPTSLPAPVYERRRRVDIERRALLGAAATLLLLGAATRAGTGPGNRTEPPVSLLVETLYVEGGLAGVSGRLENVSGQTLPAVAVAVRFLDGRGEVVAEGRDRVASLTAGAEWAFDVPCLDAHDRPVAADSVADYELAVSVGDYELAVSVGD